MADADEKFFLWEESDTCEKEALVFLVPELRGGLLDMIVPCLGMIGPSLDLEYVCFLEVEWSSEIYI